MFHSKRDYLSKRLKRTSVVACANSENAKRRVLTTALVSLEDRSNNNGKKVGGPFPRTKQSHKGSIQVLTVKIEKKGGYQDK